MRFVVTALAVSALAINLSCVRALAVDDRIVDPQAMAALVAQVRALHDQVLAGGGPQYVERHRGRGKLMVRERLEALVDPGTPVLELCPLAGLETGDPGGGGVNGLLARSLPG